MKISKKELYEMILNNCIEKEEYEICSSIRDYLKTIDNEEIFIDDEEEETYIEFELNDDEDSYFDETDYSEDENDGDF